MTNSSSNGFDSEFLIKGIRNTYAIKTDDEFVASARRVTEGICKSILVSRSIIPSMDEPFQLGDVKKKYSWEEMGIEYSAVKIAIEQIRYYGNHAVHYNETSLTRSDGLKIRKSFSELIRWFFPGVLSVEKIPNDISRHIQRSLKSRIQFEEQYESEVYLSTLNAMETDSPDFGIECSHLVNQILETILKDKFKYIPDSCYYMKDKGVIHVTEALNKIQPRPEIKNCLFDLHHYFLQSQNESNNEAIPATVKDSFYTVTEWFYKGKNEQLRKPGKRLIISDVLTLISTFSLFISALFAFSDEMIRVVIIAGIMFFGMIFSYHTMYSFFPEIRNKALKQFVNITLVVSGIIGFIILSTLLYWANDLNFSISNQPLFFANLIVWSILLNVSILQTLKEERDPGWSWLKWLSYVFIGLIVLLSTLLFIKSGVI